MQGRTCPCRASWLGPGPGCSWCCRRSRTNLPCYGPTYCVIFPILNFEQVTTQWDSANRQTCWVKSSWQLCEVLEDWKPQLMLGGQSYACEEIWHGCSCRWLLTSTTAWTTTTTTTTILVIIIILQLTFQTRLGVNVNSWSLCSLCKSTFLCHVSPLCGVHYFLALRVEI